VGEALRYHKLNHVTYATNKELLRGSMLRKAGVETCTSGIFKVAYDEVV
jgi:hypothetical protein